MDSDLPYQQVSQNLFSFYRVFRGWTSQRFILREEEDGDKLISDNAIWDPRNTYWIPGKKRLVWVCYVCYRTKEEIEDEYPGWNGAVGVPGKTGDSDLGQKLTAVFDVWSIQKDEDDQKGEVEAEEGVIIGSEYVKDPEKIGLDYLPIRINPGRTTPLISDGLHDDNIKMVGESYLASIRDILPVESRLMSYMMTNASHLAKAPMIIKFNSDLAPQPPGFDKDPYVKGWIAIVDLAEDSGAGSLMDAAAYGELKKEAE